MSPEYSDLKSCIRELRRHLLPAKFESTGSYKQPAKVSTRAAAFRVLAHAEIEAYFETRVVDIATTAWSSWRSNGHVSPVILSLLGYSSGDMKLPPTTVQPSNNQSTREWKEAFLSVYGRLNKSLTVFLRRAKLENHGIKEANILSLLLPIGFNSDKIDPLMLINLNNFGEERGRAAHTGGVFFVTQFVDPSDELKKVEQILTDLRTIDTELDLLLASAKP